MNKKILLIPSLNIVNNHIRKYIPYGLLSLLVASREYRDMLDVYMFSNKLLDTTYKDSDELSDAIIEDIDFSKYGAIGLSTVCNSFHHSLLLAQKINNRKLNTQIWLGGPHATLLAEIIIDVFTFIDAVFVGEAEQSLYNALKRYATGSINLKGIPGILVKNTDFTRISTPTDLNELPLFNIPKEFAIAGYLQNDSVFKAKDTIPLEVSRGCPGLCSFCSAKEFWGGQVRRKSAKRIIEEMNFLSKENQLFDFMFIGDNFEVPYSQLISFCKDIKSDVSNFSWACSLKLDKLKSDDLPLLWQAGCRGFFVGIESASQSTLNRIRKGVDLQHRLKIIRKAIKMGFTVEVSFIIGFPWETKNDVELTIALHRDMLREGIFRSIVFTLCPLPNTELLFNYDVKFDFHKSDIAFDDIPMSSSCRQLIEQHPKLFPQLGYFPTPQVDRNYLLSARDTANQLSYFYGLENK